MLIFSHFLFFFIFTFLSLVSILGFGKLINTALQINIRESSFIHYDFLIGLIFISFVSIIYNFFYPLNDIYNIGILTFGFLYFIFFIQNKKIFTLFNITLIAVSVSYFSGLNDDFDYHLKTILNFKNNNLFEIEHQRRTSYNSNWLFLSSIFTFKNYIQGLFVPAALLYSVLIIDLIKAKKIGIQNKNFVLSFFSFLTLIFLIGVINKSKDFGTDVPGFLFLIFIMLNIFNLTREKNSIEFNKILFVLFLFTTFSLMIKITNSLIIFYLFIFILSNKLNLIKLFSIRYLFASLPIFFWFFQNITISGCIIWPLTPLCIFDYGDSTNELYLIESFAKGDINTGMSIDGFSWISVWILNHSTKILEIYGVLILILIFPIIYFYINKKKFDLKNIITFKKFYLTNKFLFFLLVITFFSNGIWFFYYPAYRFGLFYNLSLIFYLFLPFWLNIFQIKNFFNVVSKVIFFITIIFFVYENSSRFLEYSERYGNTWPPIVNEIILNK